MKKIVYSEPAEYFPKELRKKYKLGEFNTDVYPENKPKSNTPKKTSGNRKKK